MGVQPSSPGEWGKTLAIGVGVTLTGAILRLWMKTGVSPPPKPLGLAFAETLLDTNLPPGIGQLHHVAWVALFSAVYVVLFRAALSSMHASWLALALWILALALFFPVVGWGFLGPAVVPKLIIASAVLYLLSALYFWGPRKLAFSQKDERSAGHGLHGHPAR